VVEGPHEPELYKPGDAVEYIAEPVFDLIIQTGVTRVQDGWVYPEWPRSGEHSCCRQIWMMTAWHL
jgi:hypothetical protein